VAYVTVPAIRWITNLLAPSEGGSRGGVCHGAGDSLGKMLLEPSGGTRGGVCHGAGDSLDNKSVYPYLFNIFV
jgi:hypothetical protein